ncbi:MAG: outer membrane beta-barrel protein [Verrucomicrobiota bacterium]
MNKFVTSLFAAAAIASPTFAGAPAPAAKDLEEVIEEVNYVETAKTGIILSGYVDAGYIYNFSSGGSALRAPDDNSAEGDFNLNAFKLALEKPLSDANELQAGFRVDLVFGEDAGSTFGGNTAGSPDGDSFAVEQAYVQFRMPVLNGVDVSVGKFVTWLGYDVFERPANLHITYGNLFWNAIPADHTGIAFTTSINDTIDDVGFAIVNGVNTDDGAGLTDTDTYGLMAKVNVTNPGGNANFYQSIYYSWNGANDWALGGTANGETFVYDSWGNWLPTFADDKLLLGANFNFGYAELGGTLDESFWWGTALEAKYQFTDIFSLAGRWDYFNAVDGRKLGTAGVTEEIYSYTLTAGFDLLENLLLRAEYRLDWGNGVETDGPGTDGIVHTVAAQAVYSF